MKPAAALVLIATAAVALGCSLAAPSDSLLMGESETCGARQKLCGGQCVSTLDPAVGCGAPACTPCNVPNAKAGCESGLCVVTTCENGFADCDEDPLNGCEWSIPPGEPDCGCYAIELAQPTSRIDITPAAMPAELAFGEGAWTVEAWVRPDPGAATGGTTKWIFRMERLEGIDPTSSLTMALWSESHRPRCLTDNTSADVPNAVVGPSLQDGVWHHIACIRSEAELVLFVNGVREDYRPCDTNIEEPNRIQLGHPTRPDEPVPRDEAMSLGPFRISRGVRYSGLFEPQRQWVIDDDTVIQYLVLGGLQFIEGKPVLKNEASVRYEGTSLGCADDPNGPCN